MFLENISRNVFFKYQRNRFSLQAGKVFCLQAVRAPLPRVCATAILKPPAIHALERLDEQTTKYTYPRQPSHHIFTVVARMGIEDEPLLAMALWLF